MAEPRPGAESEEPGGGARKGNLILQIRVGDTIHAGEVEITILEVQLRKGFPRTKVAVRAPHDFKIWHEDAAGDRRPRHSPAKTTRRAGGAPDQPQ